MNYDPAGLANHPTFGRKLYWADYDGDAKRVLYEMYKLRKERWGLISKADLDTTTPQEYTHFQTEWIGLKWKLIKQIFEELNAPSKVYGWLEDQLKLEKDGMAWFQR